MEEQVSIFQNFLEKIREKRIDLLIIGISLFILIINIVVFVNYQLQSNKEAEEIDVIKAKDEKKEVNNIVNFNRDKSIVVDISGGVVNSGVYEVSSSARFNDVLKKAGGLSEQADAGYFERTFNRARFVLDSEKIYIPTYTDVQLGFVSQQALLIEPEYKYTDLDNTHISEKENKSSLTNVNTATREELDELPGIGVVTADKIISNRPYSSIEELLEKKSVKSNVYEQIKDKVEI